MKNQKLTKKRIFEIIQIGNRSDRPSRAFDYLITACIIINIAAMFLDTFSALLPLRPLFKAIEIATVGVFIVEYILRLWTACYLFPRSSSGKAALRFVFTFDGIIDLLTIIPVFFLSGFVVFRMLRVVRILRLFRVNRHTDSIGIIGTVIYEKRNQLLTAIFIIIMLILAASLFMYSAEHKAQPEAFKNALSGIWWSVSTMFTVGYGDIYPITVVGRAMAIVITLLGVGAVAILTGIISAGFVEQYTKEQKDTSPVDFNLQTVRVGIDSAWIGKSVGEAEELFGINIVLIKRNNATLLPSDEYRVELGDAMVVYYEPDENIR